MEEIIKSHSSGIIKRLSTRQLYIYSNPAVFHYSIPSMPMNHDLEFENNE